MKKKTSQFSRTFQISNGCRGSGVGSRCAVGDHVIMLGEIFTTGRLVRTLAFSDDFEFHIIELPKFRPESDNIGKLPPEQKWLYFFTHATEMEANQLSELLGEEPYREAVGVLEMISKTPEDYQYYEDRLKFLRDEEAKLADAKEEGRQEGHQEGLEEGAEVGILAGKIQLLQELLGEPVAPKDDLLAMDIVVLVAQLGELQQRLRARLA